MYVWIWRHLPGHLSLKLVQVLVLFLAVTALLLFVIFPWIEPHLPISQVTVPGDKSDARPRRRQLRQLRLQPGPVPRPARRRGRWCAATMPSRRPTWTRSGVDGVLLSPGPGTPEDAGASMAFVAACADAGAAAVRGVPRPSGDRRRVRRAGRAGARAAARQDLRGAPRRHRRARRAAVAVRRDALSLAGGRGDALPPEIVVTAQTASGVVMGAAARDACRSTACSSTPSRC